MMLFIVVLMTDTQSQTKKKKKKMAANLKTNNLKPVIVLRKKLDL